MGLILIVLKWLAPHLSTEMWLLRSSSGRSSHIIAWHIFRLYTSLRFYYKPKDYCHHVTLAVICEKRKEDISTSPVNSAQFIGSSVLAVIDFLFQITARWACFIGIIPDKINAGNWKKLSLFFFFTFIIQKEHSIYFLCKCHRQIGAQLETSMVIFHLCTIVLSWLINIGKWKLLLIILNSIGTNMVLG